MGAPGFWDEPETAQKTAQAVTQLKEEVETFRSLETRVEDMEVLCELALEEDDESLLPEMEETLASIRTDVEHLELGMLLNGEYDANNAILTLHAGAGGTEAQDWTSMLLRMFSRFAEREGYEVEMLDYLPGDEAGVKSATLQINGHNAYGYLRSEKGVHRLVRISPFDANARRHTSFAAVDVMPELDDSVAIDINPADLKVDTYRASGAGGQHVNKTSSAVRLIHEPTGIVVECQTERSQFQNREYAMKMLKTKLYDMEKQKQDSEVRNARKSQVGSGDRSEKIRTYNYPQGRITDHRIGVSIYQMDDFLNGNLDEMIDNLIAVDRAEKLQGGEEE
jgi:peptide chain release factor 2